MPRPAPAPVGMLPRDPGAGDQTRAAPRTRRDGPVIVRGKLRAHCSGTRGDGPSWSPGRIGTVVCPPRTRSDWL